MLFINNIFFGAIHIWCLLFLDHFLNSKWISNIKMGILCNEKPYLKVLPQSNWSLIWTFKKKVNKLHWPKNILLLEFLNFTLTCVFLWIDLYEFLWLQNCRVKFWKNLTLWAQLLSFRKPLECVVSHFKVLSKDICSVGSVTFDRINLYLQSI